MSSITNVLDGFAGWGIGHSYVLAKKEEDEVKQGKNYYWASLSQGSQITSLVIVTQQMQLIGGLAANALSILAYPACIFFAAVKHGNYEAFAEVITEKYPRLPFPKQLSARTIKICSFFAEHTGDIVRVGMITANVALIALGATYFGAGGLASLAYEAADKLGIIPLKISLFMEKYMPIVSICELLIHGNLVSRCIILLQISTFISPRINILLQHKIDYIVRKCFSDSGPTLQEMEAPLLMRKDLTFSEIERVIKGYDHQYEINPAYCTKAVIDISSLPSNDNIEEFNRLFDAVNWAKNYGHIRNQLKEDRNFEAFLREKHPILKDSPEITIEQIRKGFDDYVTDLAKAANQTKEEFAAAWLKAQMRHCVAQLKGEEPCVGKRRDLEDAIKNFVKVIPYLLDLERDSTNENLPVHERNAHLRTLEDALIKMAIEAGAYCARAKKRVSIALVGNAARKKQPQVNVDDGLQPLYELRLRQLLHDKRELRVETVYERLTRVNLVKSIPTVVKYDVHSFDVYNNYLSLGFFPLSTNERMNIGLLDLAAWGFIYQKRVTKNEYSKHYAEDLKAAIFEMGRHETSIYLSQVFDSNPKLSADDKENVQDLFPNNQAGINRVILYMNGIIRKKRSS